MFLVKNKESGKNERLKIVICENFPDLNVGEYYNRLNIIQSFCSYHITPYIMIRRTPEYIVFSVPEFETSLSKLNIQEYFKELDRYTLILEICYATKILHHYHGLVNGNLKPSNILISKDGHYYVSDLSSYILYSDTSSGYPVNINSIDYMSPEMLYNKEITTKSDMWSIGVIMYYIFFGITPFHGKNITDIILNIKLCSYSMKLITSSTDENNKEKQEIFQEECKRVYKIIQKLIVKEERKRIDIDELFLEIKSIIYIYILFIYIDTNGINALNMKENEKKVNLTCFFEKENKHKNIEIDEDDNKNITNIKYKSNSWPHCFVNIKLTKNSGIYHFIFQVFVSRKEGGEFCFGGSNNLKYKGNDITDCKATCCISVGWNGSLLFGKNGEIVQRPTGYANDSDKFELIFNTNNSNLSIKFEDGREEMLFKDIKFPLKVFAIPAYMGDSVEIVSCWKL